MPSSEVDVQRRERGRMRWTVLVLGVAIVLGAAVLVTGAVAVLLDG